MDSFGVYLERIHLAIKDESTRLCGVHQTKMPVKRLWWWSPDYDTSQSTYEVFAIRSSHLSVSFTVIH